MYAEDETMIFLDRLLARKEEYFTNEVKNLGEDILVKIYDSI